MKKRIISALLAVCLLVSLGTVGVFADGAVTLNVNSNETYESGTAPERAEGATYKTLQEAIEKAVAGDTIEINSDLTVSVTGVTNKQGVYNISKDLNIDGNGHTITAKGEATEVHVFNITAGEVSIANVTIEGGYQGEATYSARHAIHAYGTGVELTLSSVNANRNYGYGVVVSNGATLTANGLNDSSHGWGSVNVNAQGTKATATLTGGTLNGDLVLESEDNGENKVTLNNVSAGVVKTNDNNGETVRSSGINNITINGGNITTVSLNGEGKDTVEISGATVDKIESTNSNNNNPNITITKSTVKEMDENINADVKIYESNVGNKPVNDAVAKVGDEYFDDLQAAITAAQGTNNAVVLLDNITLNVPANTAENTGAININGNVTIDGNHKIITAGGGFDTKPSDNTGLYHVINIQGKVNVTIKNLSIDGANKARSGINVFGDATSAPVVTLTDVDVQNCTTYGVTNGSAKVTASDLTTDDNGWGGVNVDSKNADATFKMTSGTLADNYSVVVGESASHDSVVNLDGGTYNTVQVKVSNTDVNISRGTYGKIELTSSVDKDVVDVTGGTFKTSVSEYVDSNMPYEAKTSSGLYTYHRTPESAADAAGQGGYVNYILGGVTHDVTLYYDKYVQTEIEVPHNYDFELPGGKFGGKEIIGWTLGGVTYKDGDEVEIDRNMTFYVVLKDGEFDIVIDSKIEHGDISTNVNSADKGDTVYIYVDPDTGYVLDDIDVYYGLNYRYSVKVSYVRNNTYRFEMPNADVYITATFKANGMPFVDVHRTQWFYDSIYYVWSNDMMEGDSATTFNPDGTMTRAMFWAVLGRMDGQTITGTNWVEQARNWAMREGVSDGTNPNDYVTREQMVTMLWRYAGEKNGSANLNRYTDSGSVSGYAVEAMRWAIGNGVIQGVTSTTLAPKANATRAECATIFMRFDKM